MMIKQDRNLKPFAEAAVGLFIRKKKQSLWNGIHGNKFSRKNFLTLTGHVGRNLVLSSFPRLAWLHFNSHPQNHSRIFSFHCILVEQANKKISSTSEK